jgi:hypothetical protein
MKNNLLALLAIPLLLAGCSKDSSDPSPSPGPKEYQVLYEVSAVKYSTANVIYRDNTGQLVTESNVPLPKTYTFKRTMQAPDAVSVGAFPGGGDASASVTCTISLDGKVVNTASGTGPAPQVVASYLIP